MKSGSQLFVKKIGNVSRNLERVQPLQNVGLNLPEVYKVDGDTFEMEYVPNIDIKTYLAKNNISKLVSYIESVIEKLSTVSNLKDYTQVYQMKLQNYDFKMYGLSITSEQLIEKLPKVLPSTEYHGDFTLENILFDTRKSQFMLIDAMTTEYDSYVFDLAKLRQDLVCGWFIRNDNINLQLKLNEINRLLTKYDFYDNNYLLILMLLRILPYTKTQADTKFLVKRIEELWK